jgi:hypothetical protein
MALLSTHLSQQTTSGSECGLHVRPEKYKYRLSYRKIKKIMCVWIQGYLIDGRESIIYNDINSIAPQVQLK